MNLSREQKAAQRKLQGFQLISDRMKAAVDRLVRADALRTLLSSTISTFSIHGEGRDKMLRAIVYLDEEVERILPLYERFADDLEKVEALVTEVQKTDPHAGRTIRMIYLKGMTPREVALEEGCSKSIVYLRLKRGLDIAYDLLRREDEV